MGEKEVRAIVYARVSSSDQKNGLGRQIQYLTQYCSAKGYRVVDIVSDIASGLKTNRRDLLKLILTHREMQKIIDILWRLDKLPTINQVHQMFYKGLREKGFKAHQAKHVYKDALANMVLLLSMVLLTSFWHF